MKLPKIKKRHCPFCKKHTEHKVTQNKKRNARTMTCGSKYRARKRGAARGTGNLGKYSKPPIGQFKRTGAKLAKKTDLRYHCTVCNKKHMQKTGFKAKRIDFV